MAVQHHLSVNQCTVCETRAADCSVAARATTPCRRGSPLGDQNAKPFRSRRLRSMVFVSTKLSADYAIVQHTRHIFRPLLPVEKFGGNAASPQSLCSLGSMRARTHRLPREVGTAGFRQAAFDLASLIHCFALPRLLEVDHLAVPPLCVRHNEAHPRK
jgi:hypothetical protein